MVQIGVEVIGKNINCSAEESVFTNSVKTGKEFFARDLGEVIYTAECAGFLINTHELYEQALYAYENNTKPAKRTKSLLKKEYEDCAVRVFVTYL